MFATQTPRANQLTFSMLLAIALMGLFVYRSQSEEFYHAGQYYALGIASLTMLAIIGYLFTLRPDGGEDVGSLNWFFGRAIVMALVGVVAGSLAIFAYTQFGDDTFLPRQLEWEAHALEKQQLPSEIVDMMLESDRTEQSLHLEEVFVVFCGGITGLTGALLASCLMLGRGRRLRQVPLTTLTAS